MKADLVPNGVVGGLSDPYLDTCLGGPDQVEVEIAAARVHTAAMAEHKFKLGESVYLSPSPYFRGAPTGIYEVVRHLPEEAGECWYRIKSASEGYERAVKESQLQKSP